MRINHAFYNEVPIQYDIQHYYAQVIVNAHIPRRGKWTL